MRRYFAYFWYVLRHKWWVAVAGLRVGCSWWRLIKHDWHKFLPSEFVPYARTFYNPDGSKAPYHESDAFKKAWNLHQKRADHHWQFWLLTWDRGDTVAIPMSEMAVLEMVADWYGAGRTITGKWGAHEWYEKNKDKIRIHEETIRAVELALKIFHK